MEAHEVIELTWPKKWATDTESSLFGAFRTRIKVKNWNLDCADLPTLHRQSARKALVHFKVLQVQGLIRYNIFNKVAASHSQDCLLPYIPNSNWEQSQCPCFLLGEQNESDPGKISPVQTPTTEFF